jgi:hypothetical protein
MRQAGSSESFSAQRNTYQLGEIHSADLPTSFQEEVGKRKKIIPLNLDVTFFPRKKVTKEVLPKSQRTSLRWGKAREHAISIRSR